MRNAEDFVREYRKRGYTDERIRVIANLTREPLRGEVLSILESGREIDLGDPAPAEERVKPQRAKEAEAVAAQEMTAQSASPPRTVPPEVKPVEREEVASPDLKKVSAQLALAQRDKNRLEKEIDDQNTLIAEFKKGAERVAAITRQLDEARHDIEQAQEQTAEKDAALEAAMKDRREAQQKADEYAEKIAESEATVTAFQERIAQQERQLKEIRVRAEQDAAKLRKDSDFEVRNLKRRIGTFKRAAVGSAIAAVLLLAVILVMPHATVGHMPKPPHEVTTATAPVTPHDATSTTGVAAAPGTHPSGNDQMVSAMTFADNGAAPGASQQPATGPVLTGMTTAGPETPSNADATARAGSVAKPTAASAKANAKGKQTVAAAAASPSSGGTMYTVKKGDSLWKIAKKQLGNANMASAVAKENNITVTTPLKVGMQLKLPAKAGAPTMSM